MNAERIRVGTQEDRDTLCELLKRNGYYVSVYKNMSAYDGTTWEIFFSRRKKMKEVTEWDGNPREMWVWDGNPKDKKKRFVVYILREPTGAREAHGRRVLCLDDDNITWWYRHCAEIEQQRLMTNKELARWLRERPDREVKHNGKIFSTLNYEVNKEDDIVENYFYVREGDGPWFVPFKEQEDD